MRIKKGDTVKVLYGKDSGKTGKILMVNRKSNTVVVDGMNIHTRHVKGDGQSRKSEIVSIIKPMPIAKVMLVDPGTDKSSRVKFEIKDGKKVRVAVKTGKEVDLKITATEEKKVEKKTKKPVVKSEEKKKAKSSKKSK